MSINNRKYIQSTGSLLTRLAEESNNTGFNQHQRDIMQQQMLIKSQGPFQQNVNMNSYNRTQPQQMPYQNYQQPMPQYTTSNNIYLQQQQAQSNVQMFNPGNLQPVTTPAQLLNQMPNSKQDLFNQRRYQQHHGSYNTSRDSKKPHQKKQPQQQKQNNSGSSSSSVTELPETFGLPSNSKKYSKTSLSESKPDISSDEMKVPVNGESRSSNSEIEIIEETNCEDSNLIISTSSTAPPIQSKQSSDELFRSYLGRKFKGQLAITTKPQCNFISNFSCISQLLVECDYYTQRQRRPYSNIKLRNIYTNESEGAESDMEDEDDIQVKKKLKTTHVIIIDDTNEEMHKPWITDDLIKLIKHRNMLQAKLGEKNSEGCEPDEELVKKFKNLRNKVTKLVKKARKDYLAKYIADSKEMKKTETEKQVLDSALAASLSQQAPPPPPSTTEVSTEAANNIIIKQTSPSKPTVEEPYVAKITGQLISSKKESGEAKSSFLKSQNTLMMGLYNTYYNQYIQQYQSQQEEAHKLAQAAAEHEKKMNSGGEVNTDETTKSSFELLQKQASYYAKQQASIQSQLEASLNQSAHQLIQEITQMAAAQAQKPFVINQFTHQQQHHLHQHIHPNTSYSQPTPVQQQQYQPQSINSALNSYEPAQQQQINTQQQPSGYNMHYNYNMVVS